MSRVKTFHIENCDDVIEALDEIDMDPGGTQPLQLQKLIVQTLGAILDKLNELNLATRGVR